MSITSSNLAEIAASLRGGAAPVTSVADSASSLTLVGDEGDESVVTASESVVDDGEQLSAGSEDTSGDKESGSAEPAANSSSSSGKESITVTDDKGKRKVEIDWNNKEQLKKYVQMAHGARKWQAERDQALSAKKSLEEKISSLSSNWETLENAYQSKGVAGLVDLLEGRQGAFDEWEKARIERHTFLQKATPEQRELLAAREAEAARQSEIDRIRKENEDFKKSIASEREAAEMKALESTVHPVFDRYRFADKLGDSDTEAMFDEMLWTSALKRLEPYEDKGIPVTADLVEKEFKAVAVALRKRINVQAEKKAAKAVEQKKQEATENAQAAVSNGYRGSSVNKEALDLAKSGNIGAIFKNWNKFKGSFGG